MLFVRFSRLFSVFVLISTVLLFFFPSFLLILLFIKITLLIHNSLDFYKAEDNFFGPVSANFIRPGRLSDSAASDENHDVTMDSTAFSMHFRSLARSESADLKTPTGGQLFFEEKTPTDSNKGSSMVYTVGIKPVPRSPVPAIEVSAMHGSSDMSLVGESPNKYDYAKLSPGLDALLAESRKNLLYVNASDGIASASPKRSLGQVSSSVDHGDNLVNCSDSIRKGRSKVNNSLLNEDQSGDANGSRGNLLGGCTPRRSLTSTLDVAASNKESHEPKFLPCQLNKVSIHKYAPSLDQIMWLLCICYWSFWFLA